MTNNGHDNELDKLLESVISDEELEKLAEEALARHGGDPLAAIREEMGTEAFEGLMDILPNNEPVKLQMQLLQSMSQALGKAAAAIAQLEKIVQSHEARIQGLEALLIVPKDVPKDEALGGQQL